MKHPVRYADGMTQCWQKEQQEAPSMLYQIINYHTIRQNSLFKTELSQVIKETHFDQRKNYANPICSFLELQITLPLVS